MVVTNGLLSYWKFANNLRDSFGSVNGVMTKGIQHYLLGAKTGGTGFHFDGAKAINISSSTLQPANGITFDFWMKLKDISSQQFAISLGGSSPATYVAVQPTRLEFTKNSSDAQSIQMNWSGSGVDPLVWNHYSLVYDKIKMYIFVNKVLKAVVARTETMTYQNTICYIGCDSVTTSNLRGFLDEVKIYNRGLTHGTAENVGETATGEVQQNYDDSAIDISIAPETKTLVLSEEKSLVEITSTNSSPIIKGSLPTYVKRGLVSYWPLTENGTNTGNYHDLAYLLTGSATINNGTRTGAGLPIDGPKTLAMDFSGDDYVNVPAHSSLVMATKYTYQIWVRNVGSNVVFNSGDVAGTAYNALMTDGTNFDYRHGSSPLVRIPRTAFPGTEWTQLTYVWDSTQTFGNRLRAYINGAFYKLADTDTGTSNPDVTGHVVVGALGDFSGKMPSGQMAEFLAYNVALTPEEIKQNFDAVIEQMPIRNGLISYWKLDEDSASSNIPIKDSAMKEFGSGSTPNDLVRTGTAPQVAAGINGEVVQSFSGDDYGIISSNASLNPTAGVSFVGWARAETLNTYNVNALMGKGTGGACQYMFGTFDQGTNTFGMYMEYRNGGGTPTGTRTLPNTITVTNWMHLAYTVENGKQRCFLNGVEMSVDVGTSSWSNSDAGDLYLGMKGSNGTGKWIGQLKNFKLYNRALSSWEIRKMYEFDLGIPNIVTRGLVSWYRMQDNGTATGNIRDSAYRTFGVGANPPNDGTKSATTTNSVAGVWGQALDYSGDDYVTIPTNSAFASSSSGQYSTEAWIKDAVVSGTHEVFRWVDSADSYNLLSFMLVSTGIAIGQSWATVTWANMPTYSANRWNHIVATYNNTSWKLYVNGTQVGSGTNSMTTNANNKIALGYTNYFVGKYGDAKFYNVELTATEVLQNYNAYRRGI